MIDWKEPHTEAFIEDHLKELSVANWKYICAFQPLSEEFIEKYANRLDWSLLCEFQKLSESFIEKHMDRLACRDCWYRIFKYQKLSEAFIEKYLDKGIEEAGFAGKYQVLSERLIEKCIGKLDCYRCGYEDYQRVSPEFREKHEATPMSFQWNWLYRDTVFKRRAVQDTELYECYDDYFIAYKAIRKDRYSIFNFQYKYEKGGVYETHADYTDAEDSFGFGAGTKEFAEDYGGLDRWDYNIVVRVKIYYKDVARVVHNGDKIRACKIEVLD